MRISESRIRQIIREEVAGAIDEDETDEERSKRVDFEVKNMAWNYTEGGKVSVKQLKQIIEDNIRFALGHENLEDFPNLKEEYRGWKPEDFKKMVQSIYKYLGIDAETSETLF